MTRGWIGVQIQPVTPEIADSIGLKKATGALVSEPQANSPAAKAGIESGDVITSVDGTAVTDARDLARRIGMMAPGTSVKLGLIHKGQDKTVTLTLGTLPNERQAANQDEGQHAAPARNCYCSRANSACSSILCVTPARWSRAPCSWRMCGTITSIRRPM